MEGRYSKYFIIIIILLSFFVFISILPYFYIDYNPIPIPSDILDSHQGLISLGGVIVAIIIFWYTLKRQNDDKKRDIEQRLHTACDLVEQEVRQYQNTLRGGQNIIFDRDPPFRGIFFSIDGYESVLHSGLFSHFERNTQDFIKRIYVRISLHNDVLKQRQTFRDNFFLYDTSISRINRWYNAVRNYNSLLNAYEMEILRLIEDVLPLIQREREKTIT